MEIPKEEDHRDRIQDAYCANGVGRCIGRSASPREYGCSAAVIVRFELHLQGHCVCGEYADAQAVAEASFSDWPDSTERVPGSALGQY